MNHLIDQEIAHITRVMRPSLLGDLGGPILSSAYWRRRLHVLLDAPSLTKMQFRAIDSMLVLLDHYDRRNPDTGEVTSMVEVPLEVLATSGEPLVLHG